MPSEPANHSCLTATAYLVQAEARQIAAAEQNCRHAVEASGGAHAAHSCRLMSSEPANHSCLIATAYLVQAEARQLAAAEQNCRQAVKASGGAHGSSWALLALVLSARHQLPAALAVVAAGLQQAGPAYESLLLKIKVGLQTACCLGCCCCWAATSRSSLQKPATEDQGRSGDCLLSWLLLLLGCNKLGQPTKACF